MKHARIKTVGTAALGAAFAVGAAGSAAAVTDAVTDTAGSVAGGVTSSLHDVATDQEMYERLSGVPQQGGAAAADETLSAPSVSGLGGQADPAGQAVSHLLGGLPTGNLGVL